MSQEKCLLLAIVDCVQLIKKLLLILEGEVEFDEERVIQVGHHVPLFLHVLLLVLLRDMVVVQDLNCIFLPC